MSVFGPIWIISLIERGLLGRDSKANKKGKVLKFRKVLIIISAGTLAGTALCLPHLFWESKWAVSYLCWQKRKWQADERKVLISTNLPNSVQLIYRISLEQFMPSSTLKFGGGFLPCLSLLYKALDNMLKRGLPSYLCPCLFLFHTRHKQVLEGGDGPGTEVSIQDGHEFIALFLRKLHFELKQLSYKQSPEKLCLGELVITRKYYHLQLGTSFKSNISLGFLNELPIVYVLLNFL